MMRENGVFRRWWRYILGREGYWKGINLERDKSGKENRKGAINSCILVAGC
jgi:hypothetical protein